MKTAHFFTLENVLLCSASAGIDMKIFRLQRWSLGVGANGLLVLLGPDAGVRVGDPDGQLLSALHQSLAVLGRNSVGNLGAELFVLHHQNLQLLKKIKKKHDISLTGPRRADDKPRKN